MPESTTTSPTRPMTPKAARRSWNEPAVRGWWMTAMVTLLIVGWLSMQQIFVSHNSRYRLDHWIKINAATLEKLGGESRRSYRVLPDSIPTLPAVISYVDSAGQRHELEGFLLAQNAPLRPGETLTILVDPDHPSTFTDRVKPLPFIEEMIAPLVLLPLPLFCIAAAFLQRRRFLNLWRTGLVREARVMRLGSTALSPASVVLHCVLEGQRANRIVKVTVPRSLQKFVVGDPVSLVTPAHESSLAIATCLYE